MEELTLELGYPDSQAKALSPNVKATQAFVGDLGSRNWQEVQCGNLLGPGPKGRRT